MPIGYSCCITQNIGSILDTYTERIGNKNWDGDGDTAGDGDGDGDTASDSKTLNLGSSLLFKDDGPSITVATVGSVDTLTVDDSTLGTAASASFADNFSNSPNVIERNLFNNVQIVVYQLRFIVLVMSVSKNLKGISRLETQVYFMLLEA